MLCGCQYHHVSNRSLLTANFPTVAPSPVSNSSGNRWIQCLTGRFNLECKILHCAQRKSTRHWVGAYEQPQQPDQGESAGVGHFMFLPSAVQILKPTAEATMKSQCTNPDNVWIRNDCMRSWGREPLRTHIVRHSVCVLAAGRVGCAGSSPTKTFHFHQLQGISHTSSIFFQQYCSTGTHCLFSWL